MRNAVLIMLVFVLAGALVAVVYWPVWQSASQPSALVARPTPPLLQEQAPKGIPAGALVFCSDPWPPYAGVAEDPNPGYIVEVLQRIFEREGFEVAYINLPWTRCIEDTREGRVTALAGAAVEEVPDFIFPQHTIGRTQPTFFAEAESEWEYGGVASLAAIRLGVIQDYSYAPEVDEFIKAHGDTDRILSVKGRDPLSRLIDALLEQRIDALVENGPVVLHTLKRLDLVADRIKAVGGPPAGVDLYIPFSPRRVDSEALTRIFDLGLERLRARGALEPILARYGVADWVVPTPNGGVGDNSTRQGSGE